MSKLINTGSNETNTKEVTQQELPFATDQECAERRQALIRGGVISKGTSKLITKENGTVAVCTAHVTAALRKKLIARGIIDPNYVKLSYPKSRGTNREEGEYRVNPIRSDAEYNKRRANYFRMLQEILVSRRELGLILGPKDENDPEWVF